jgi:hypothetical protein
MSKTIAVKQQFQVRGRPLGAALTILAVGLAAGLVLTNFPVQAGSSVSGDGARVGDTTTADQAYRAGERQSLAQSDASAAWLQYRAGEHADLAVQPAPRPDQAFQQYRAGERQSLTQPDAAAAYQDYRAGERESLP